MDIEEDIKILKKAIEEANKEDADMNDCFAGEEIEAIYHILSERETDKKKIDKLEKINRNLKYLYDDCCKCLVESIDKQKVKDYLEEEKERFEVYKKESETNEILKFGMYRHLGAKNMCEKILGIEKNIATLD